MLDSTIAYDLTFLVPADDNAIGFALRMCGEFARVELDFLELFADGEGVLLDVGANVGPIGLPFARRRPTWRVVAVEAHAGLAGLLAANAFNNRLWNVRVLQAAAGAAAGLADFPAQPLDARMNFGALGFGADGPTEPVRMLTLDSIAPADVRIVKIDVEGYEVEVLKGAGDLIARKSAIWMIEATGSHSQVRAEVIATFQKAGYRVCWFYAPFCTPTSPKAKPGRPATGDVNVVALPPGVASPWELVDVGAPDERPPASIAGYRYLEAYGYDPAAV